MAEDQDEASKTEDASAKKLADARQKGQVPKSQEFNHLFIIGASLVLTMTVLPWSFGQMAESIRPFLERPHTIPMDPGGLAPILLNVLFKSGIGFLPPLLLLLLAGVMASVVQVGWLVSTENFLSFKLSRLNPLTNLKQKFSVKNLVEFGKSLAKLALVGTVVFFVLLPLWGGVEHLIALPVTALVDEAMGIAAKVMFAVVMVLLVLALADYMYQRFAFMKQMRMTKQEMKDEFKQMEGDPLIKAKIRQLRMERSRGRMMAAVPEADVVVTNPTHYAVALKYDQLNMAAPKVVAMGQDHIALRIRELAKEHDVPIVENPPLARALYATAEIDEEIPAEHYKAVAQVISYVFKLRQRPVGGRPD